MSIFNNDKCLAMENERLKSELTQLKWSSEVNNTELEALREAIKPYVKLSEHFNLFNGSKHFNIDRTLQQADKELSELKLYIAVLEGELGEEWAESAKAKFKALKELKQ